MNATLDKDVAVKLEDLKEELKEEVITQSEKLCDDPAYLQKNFVMLHGTNCAWDKETGSMIKCDNMKLSFPMSFPIWRSNPERKIIPSANLVFDPKNKYASGYEAETHFNMFDKTRIKPATYGNGWKPWALHLLKLCGDDQKTADWVTCWFAYLLQNLGSKMRTSIVMHGDEGAGKNLLVDPVQAIFGVYGHQIGQAQIESQFNAWASCKLFIVANEVISRRERKHIKGKLQALISEPIININQKSMPERVENNFANFVFLSNEDVPVDTNRDDRRFMVICVEKTDDMDAEYFKELKENIIESDLHGYLLNHNCELYDVDEEGKTITIPFNEHTKPLLNDAKKAIIEANLSSQQLFIKSWLAGDTQFPVKSVPSTLLYWAYRCWCAVNGEKFPCSSTAFGTAARKFGIVSSRSSIKFTTSKVTMYFINDQIETVVEQSLFDEFNSMVDDLRRKYNVN